MGGVTMLRAVCWAGLGATACSFLAHLKLGRRPFGGTPRRAAKVRAPAAPASFSLPSLLSIFLPACSSQSASRAAM